LTVFSFTYFLSNFSQFPESQEPLVTAINYVPRVFVILRNVNSQLVTDVSGQLIGTIFKGQRDGIDGVLPKHPQLTENKSCVTSQKSEDLVQDVTEA
jgi:hypothetical protein